MPYALPRDPTQQIRYNQQLHQAYQSTRRVAPFNPGSGDPSADPVARLRELSRLHEQGSLTDAEFAQAKSLVFASSGDGSSSVP
jgi:hypothetical protein